jgi:uncharacterized membrane protein (TIGR02234 family)
VLVLRGRTRRVVAVVGALASAGALVATLADLAGAQDDALALVRAGSGTDTATATLTGWYVAAVVGAALAAAAFVVAVRSAPGWPEMGRRYDAPGARAEPAPTDAPATEQDMWRTLDDGRDPTA